MDSTAVATPDAPAEPAAAHVQPAAQPDDQPAVLEQDLLVEDVSIDGMCGVY